MKSPFLHIANGRNTDTLLPKGRPYLITLFEHQEFF